MSNYQACKDGLRPCTVQCIVLFPVVTHLRYVDLELGATNVGMWCVKNRTRSLTQTLLCHINAITYQ